MTQKSWYGSAAYAAIPLPAGKEPHGSAALKYFCHAAETENFARTAEAFLVPPSSIPHCIKLLDVRSVGDFHRDTYVHMKKRRYPPEIVTACRRFLPEEFALRAADSASAE